MSLSSGLSVNPKSQFAQETGSIGDGLLYQSQNDAEPKLGAGFFLRGAD